MPSRALLAVLVLVAALALASPASAVVNNPDGTLNKDGQGAEEAAGQAPPAGQLKDAAKAAEKRENEASKSIEEMLRKAAAPTETPASSPPTGSPPRGGRKTIYGDIIIHK